MRRRSCLGPPARLQLALLDSRREPALSVSPRQIGCDLSEVLKPRRALGQVSLKPSHRGLLVLRRSALRVQVDELERVLEQAGGRLAELAAIGRRGQKRT